MRHTAAGVGAMVTLLLLSMAGGGATAAEVASTIPAVLRSSAVPSKKASVSALLTVVRAGSRLVAAGERGIVLLSDDAGVSWRQASVPVQTSLTTLRFVDQNNGWAVGHLGVIVHSVDGGANWTLQWDGLRAAAAVAAALRSSEDPRDQRNADQWLNEGPDKPFFDIDFNDGGRGYAVGAYNMAFTTADGGKTWLSLATSLPNPQSLHLYAVRARGEKVFIAGERGLLLRSLDGGASFESMQSPYKGSFFGLLMTRKGTLLAYGLRGSLYRSSDDGSHWQMVETGIGTAIGAGIERDDGKLLLSTQDGKLLASVDDGLTFKLTAAPASVPVAGLAAAPDGALVLATLRGMRRHPTP